MLPVTVSLYGASPSQSFVNLASLTNATTSVSVQGAGAFMVHFGTENAAWLEFDSPDLQPQDVPLIQLSVSEWTEPYTGKVKTPVKYNTTYRLETNSELYEGVRFGFFLMAASPSRPFTITGMRAVSQAKAVNYTGSFTAAGDDLLTRIWYTAAYTVRLNLEARYFGAILMYRGDRYSWTGDAHVAQSAAMTAFGNYPFVLDNMQRTASDCNGIESYCLYWALSAMEYWRRSGDEASFSGWLPNIDAKLTHAQTKWNNPTSLSFFGWDDRLGSGFANASTTESQFAYRFVAMRCWKEFAAALSTLGNRTGSAAYQAMYDTAAVAVHSTWGDQWYAQLGVHAAADAINAGFMNTQEVAAVLATQLNDSVTICSLSNFNQYWILQALGNAGAMDKALASIRKCWGDEIALGATSFWEISHPDWATDLRALQPMPYGNNGVTSLCHPWSAGPVSWLSANVAGVEPLEPGYANVRVTAHVSVVSGRSGGVSGRVPTPHGVVSITANGTAVEVYLPGTVTGVLHLSAVLLHRLGWLADGKYVRLTVNGQAAELEWLLDALRIGPLLEDEDLQGLSDEMGLGAYIAGSGAGQARWRVAVLYLSPGTTVVRPLAEEGTPTVVNQGQAPLSGPFPTPAWPGRLVDVDTSTQGSWLGRYGGAGYVLAAYRPGLQDLVALPSFIASYEPFQATADSWTAPDPALDPRALQDPASTNASSPRAIGVWYASMTTAVDLWMPAALEGQVWYQVAVYCVDYDQGQVSHNGYGPRRQTVALLDRTSLNAASPMQYADSTVMAQGVWYVFQYNRSVRIRMSQLAGDNAVISAVAFDTVE